MNLRLRDLCSRIAKAKLDCLLVTTPANISYLVKFASHDSYLLVSKEKGIYFTDSRYIDEVRPRLLKEDLAAKLTSGPVFDTIAAACEDLNLKRIGFEGQSLTTAAHKRLQEAINRKCRLILTNGMIEEIRQIKDSEELRKIKKALHITMAALRFAQKLIKPGKKEIEVAAELERFIRYHGATSSAFDMIVASGPNSAYPHHAPGSRKIKNNEPVLIDIGVEYQGYKSDLTRVYFLGKISFLAQQVSKTVFKAQSLALSKIRPGVKIAEIDRVSRNYIAAAGYGEHFGHSLGHGVGLETHESPRISGRTEGLLKPGMVFTVEPAIYLVGKFGIRIEDMVLVTKKGCEVLSGAIDQ
jgi:Xaa-Pro aminopeptidase